MKHLDDELVPVMEDWCTHFKLRDIQQGALRADLDRPADRKIYRLSGYQDDEFDVIPFI